MIVSKRNNANVPAIWLLVLITSTNTLAANIITPALPGITESFSTTPESSQRVLTGFLMMIGIGQLIFGPLSDRFGRRFALMVGLALYCVGSVLALVATNLEFLVFSRFLQGFGASAAIVLPRVIINDTHSPRAGVSALAAVTAAMAITPMIAFPVGGLLFESSGWRGSIAVTLLFGLMTIVPTFFLLHETHLFRKPKLDVLSITVDYFSLLKNRQFLLFVSHMGLTTAIFFALVNFLPFTFETLGYSPSEFGSYMMVVPLGYIVGNLTSRKLTPIMGITKMVRVGSLITLIGMSVMAFLVIFNIESAWGLAAPAMVYSFAAGCSLPNATMGAINAVGQSVRGLGSGLAGSLQMLISSGIAAGTILFGAANDIRIGVGILLIVALVAVTAALFLRQDLLD